MSETPGRRRSRPPRRRTAKWSVPGAAAAHAPAGPAPPRGGSRRVVLVGAAVVGYFRLGRAPLRGVVWAEDGAVFLADAYRTDLLTGAFKPYNGYALFQPRVMAELISWAPLTWQGQLLSVTAALCQAGVALLAFHVVRAHARTQVPPLLVAAVVAAVPVGIEVVDNLANSQWFLLAGAVLAVFWSPARWPGQVASAVVVFVAATSCPFAGLRRRPGRAQAGWSTGAGRTCRSPSRA